MSAVLRRNHPYLFHSAKKHTYDSVRKTYFNGGRIDPPHLRETISKQRYKLNELITIIDDQHRIYQGPLRQWDCLQDIGFLGCPELSEDLRVANHISANTCADWKATRKVWMCLMKIQVLEEVGRALHRFRDIQVGIINMCEVRVKEGVKNHFKKLSFLKILSAKEKFIIVHAYVKYRREMLMGHGAIYPEPFYYGITTPTAHRIEFQDLALGLRQGWPWGGLVCREDKNRKIKTYKPGRKHQCVAVYMYTDGRLEAWRVDGLLPPCPHCVWYYEYCKKYEPERFPRGLKAEHCGCLDMNRMSPF